ncbi:MBL fold metallo-hydrolase [Candidatus Nitronereus thalassa]|uniref:MBL fold metallo-hydrolase n=1 Tax=Candidatus Nitronereus thalassa TaxID=3020898 RepID=A0ABU3K705_9BACT|nr:MBL fold metallo-hydrolase [Candidatus Nitronereus thalassa]MDT7042207.1 MBL fold metallo-hydrolase [Candidatus Nitronereus thalassa]
MKHFIGMLVMTLLISNIALAKDLPPNTAKIAPGVYSYGNPANGYFSMFMVTEDGVIAIESVSSQHAAGMIKAIKAITGQPIRYLLHSHNHWDHSSGGKVFRDAGATLIAHEEAYTWMKANPGPDMVVPDESWEGNRKDITLGGTNVELHYLGMNHGLGMTVFLLPQEKIAYIADLVVPNRVMFTIVPDFNIKEWERSLRVIEQMDFDKAVYSHSHNPTPLLGGTKQDVTKYLQFMQDLRGAIFAEFKKGTNPMMVPNVVQLPKYKDWAMYKEWLPMNAWRILLDEWMGPFPWRPDKD